MVFDIFVLLALHVFLCCIRKVYICVFLSLCFRHIFCRFCPIKNGHIRCDEISNSLYIFCLQPKKKRQKGYTAYMLWCGTQRLKLMAVDPGIGL